ncbi:MAG TPA: biotin/lipoyl-containing protein [Candidatus Dormibacteraeota bacterium]|nr:biotin/lipoyl-containing protein [Candidatus Dormibacteraeota bacterium]
MKRNVRIEGKNHSVEAERRAGGWDFRIDGKPIDADAAEISPGLFSILLEGKSFLARVVSGGARLEIEVGSRRMIAEVSDPRRSRRSRGELEREGHQRILAPMPGKILRVLVGKGSPVEAGQAILVIEAMKMQNEVRSPKAGTLERLLVSEAQAVGAGELLAVVA